MLSITFHQFFIAPLLAMKGLAAKCIAHVMGCELRVSGYVFRVAGCEFRVTGTEGIAHGA